MNAKKTACLAFVAAAALVFVGANAGADDKAANATGTWKWTRKTQDGNEQEIKAELKQDGGKVTGKVISPMGEFDIKDGKVKEGKITFKFIVERDGNMIEVHFDGKLDGDAIKGTVEFEANGEKRKLDWNAKREKKEK